MDGPYQTNLPPVEDIISSIRVDRDGQVRRIRHEEEIDVLEYQVLTREIEPSLKPLEEIIRESVFCLGGRKAHLLGDKQIPSVGVFDEASSKDAIGLLLDSLLTVVGATFDRKNYQPLDKLSVYQMPMVEASKQKGLKNLNELNSVMMPITYTLNSVLTLTQSVPKLDSFATSLVLSSFVSFQTMRDLSREEVMMVSELSMGQAIEVTHLVWARIVLCRTRESAMVVVEVAL
ncbi:hypothetical protein Tco_0259712 [Tanacetum coccineum]